MRKSCRKSERLTVCSRSKFPPLPLEKRSPLLCSLLRSMGTIFSPSLAIQQPIEMIKTATQPEHWELSFQDSGVREQLLLESCAFRHDLFLCEANRKFEDMQIQIYFITDKKNKMMLFGPGGVKFRELLPACEYQVEKDSRRSEEVGAATIASQRSAKSLMASRQFRALGSAIVGSPVQLRKRKMMKRE